MSAGRQSSDYTRCPRCGHRTVLFHFGRNGEDYLACVYRRRQPDGGWTDCGWEVFRWEDKYDTETDRRERQAWQEANPRLSDAPPSAHWTCLYCGNKHLNYSGPCVKCGTPYGETSPPKEREP